jgi:hypothetical protein
MQTIDQGEKSMKQELLTNQDAAITTHDEENGAPKLVRCSGIFILQMCNRCVSNAHYSILSVNLTVSVDFTLGGICGVRSAASAAEVHLMWGASTSLPLILQAFGLVPGGGIEPPRAEARRILSPLRLQVYYC